MPPTFLPPLPLIRSGDRPPPAAASSTTEPQEAFAELGRILVDQLPTGQIVTRVADLARTCVPGAEEVSVSLIEEDRTRTVTFTDRLAATLDERQYADGFGPCLDAARGEQVIRIDDTADEAVYPDFAAIAARQGVRSILAVGFPMPPRMAGALNVYRFDDGQLDDDAVELLQVFGGYAAVALANHSLFASAVALNGHLTTAMQSREIIDVAKGVLVGRLHCTPAEAFTYLVDRSQERNRRVRDIAREVVDRAAQP